MAPGTPDKAVEGTTVDGTKGIEKPSKVKAERWLWICRDLDGKGFRVLVGVDPACRVEENWRFATMLREAGAGGAWSPGSSYTSMFGWGWGSFAQGVTAWRSRREG